VQLRSKEIERVFRKLEIETKTSPHHVVGWLVVDGRRVLPLHYSRGRDVTHGRLAHPFRKSLHLTPPEFAAMMNCTMTRDEYIEILRERGII